MLRDAIDTPKGAELEADLCIIGGGGAGLAIASALERSGLRILVLESGAVEPAPQSDALISGRNAAPTPYELSGQRRRLGGGLNDWGANCSLLETTDFEPAPELELAPWPIAADALSEFAEPAARLAGFADGSPGEGLADTAQSRPSARFGDIAEKLYLRADPGAAVARAAHLRAADSPIDIVTRATAVGLDVSANGGVVDSVRFRDRAGDVRIARARSFVLAAGVESVPFLMRALGPEARMRLPALGRRLHAHLLTLHGFLRAEGDLRWAARYALPGDLGGDAKLRVRRFFGLQAPPQIRRRERMLNSALFLAPIIRKAPMMTRATLRRARGGARPPSRLEWKLAAWLPNGMRRRFGVGDFAIRHFMEQPARWGSRVELGAPSGPLGSPEPVFHWSIGEAERHTMHRNCALLGAAVAAAGVGRVDDEPDAGRDAETDFHRNAHPMGGAIMGADPSLSVVDAELRVHGFANLYVCGGAVLPSSGAAMVTAVIFQLATRLAGTLRREFGR